MIYLNISFPWQNLVMYFKTTCSWCALISINFIFLNLIYFYNTILIPTPIPPGTKPQTESNCKSLKSDNRCRYYCFYDSLSPTLTPQSPTRRTFCRLNCSQKSFLSQPSYNHNLLIAEIICLFYLGFVRVFTPQRVRYLFIYLIKRKNNNEKSISRISGMDEYEISTSMVHRNDLFFFWIK